MPVCSFCKQGYEFPRGTTVVQKEGSIKYYCSSKCRKNAELGRISKNVNWVRKADIVSESKEKKENSFEIVERAEKFPQKEKKK